MRNSTFLPVLETSRLVLRKLELADVDDMYGYASDPEVTRYVTWDAHISRENTLGYLKFLQQRYKTDRCLVWGVVLKENNKLIGTCDYVRIDNTSKCGILGYALAREYWNQGLMSEAVRAIIDFGFEVLDLNRIEAHCMVANLASERVMQKTGMTFEGILREKVFLKNQFISLKMYSILKKEWNNDKQK